MHNAPRSQEEPLLNIQDLTVAYREDGRWVEAVRDISFYIHAGETYGLVGESGSGKTTLALSIMRYLPEEGMLRSGKIELNGRDLLRLNEGQMRRVWGKEIGMVPQNPQSSLNPAMRVGEQLAEILRHHFAYSPTQAHRRMLELFEQVQLADPERVAGSYPHQVSGGMQQRVMIAMAISTEPSLLVLDEPTTNLDTTTQAAILDLIRELIRGRQTAALYVTHNLGVVAQVCERVAVLYAGELVEDASAQETFWEPLHPYTRGLLDSVPRLGETKDRVQLRAIQGQIPALGERPSGCVFTPRCPLAIEICEQRPPLYSAPNDRRSRCHRWDEIWRKEVSARQPSPEASPAQNFADGGRPAVLELKKVKVDYPVRRSLDALIKNEPAKVIRAVAGVSLEIKQGETLGLVGESGSGKTSLARAVMGLVEKTSGSMELLAFPLPPKLSQRDLETLRHLQMVFQNPEEAFNPYMTVGESLRRPFQTLMGKSKNEAGREVARLLAEVRLPASYANRLPNQLSGGEKQRVAIARAFATNPDLLVCDEPISGLDVSVQAAILNLLNELQIEHGSSLLFISHNLAVVGYLGDKVAVIYLGHLMELAGAGDLFEPPHHPYTEALLSAIPLLDPLAEQKRIRLEGEIPRPTDLPSGCPFHTRCPRFLGDICVRETPPWRVDESTGKRYFCHIPVEELRAVQERVFRFHEEDLR